MFRCLNYKSRKPLEQMTMRELLQEYVWVCDREQHGVCRGGRKIVADEADRRERELLALRNMFSQAKSRG